MNHERMLTMDRTLNRRHTLQAALAVYVATQLAGIARPSVASGQATPNTEPGTNGMLISGEAVPELAGFDRAMTELMARWDLPGGQLAVAKDGRLALNRGYGLADVEAGEPVQPDSLFRIASVSKAITAIAILALVDDGQLSLDDRAFSFLDLTPPANAMVDPRLSDITIEHLLTHSGGWDMGASFEPQGTLWSTLAAHVLDEPQPASAETIARFMLGFPLDFDPGSRSVYSNFGFNVLGRVIEQVSGQSYAEFTQASVLVPAGIDDMVLAKTRLEDRAPGEVRYYGPAGQMALPSVYLGEGFAPFAYGAYFLESFDAHGGWLASAGDLVRLATAVDGQRGEALLAPSTVEAMIRTPRTPEGVASESEFDFGLGWDGVQTADGFEWSRAGALPGSTAAWMVRTLDGLAIAYVFNSLPEAWPAFFEDTEATLRETAAAIQTWPAHDLFDL
jgi:N-acyl-D-amino-acid deacylase